MKEYTAAPVFMDANAKCRHQWLIEFAKKPENISEFADILDRQLQAINSDYEAKRFHDITLQRLRLSLHAKVSSTTGCALRANWADSTRYRASLTTARPLRRL